MLYCPFDKSFWTVDPGSGGRSSQCQFFQFIHGAVYAGYRLDDLSGISGKFLTKSNWRSVHQMGSS